MNLASHSGQVVGTPTATRNVPRLAYKRAPLGAGSAHFEPRYQILENGDVNDNRPEGRLSERNHVPISWAKRVTPR